MKNILSKGAEAVVFVDDDRVIKKRVPKSYRHPVLDHSIRLFRTRRESKILHKLGLLISADESEYEIIMPFIKGNLVRDLLSIDNYARVCKLIGLTVKELHNKGIIHGDLTTSNMIFQSDKVVLIDFGLSFFSSSIEHIAVDLHLLKAALSTKHPEFQDAFNIILEAYEPSKQVLDKLLVVEKRGRYKRKAL